MRVYKKNVCRVDEKLKFKKGAATVKRLRNTGVIINQIIHIFQLLVVFNRYSSKLNVWYEPYTGISDCGDVVRYD